MSANELAAAILAQLRAEIAAGFSSNRAFAASANIDYVSLTRYLKGDRRMPLDVLMQALAALNLDPASFFSRAQERSGQ